jgi:hypothetical protein
MARFENVNVNKLAIVTGTSAPSQGSACFLITKTVNVSANGTTDTQTSAALSIPANTYVLNVFTDIVTSANATCSATVGDGDAAAGWDASVNLKTARNAATGAGRTGATTSDTYVNGKLYSSADTIDWTITFSTTTTTGVFKAQALCAKAL